MARPTTKKFTKHDAGKVRFDLLPPEAELEVAKAFTHGAIKYSDDNYRVGTKWRRYIAAERRHVNAWLRRENFDDESSLNHLSHAIACLMMLLTLQITEKGLDDRPPVQLPTRLDKSIRSPQARRRRPTAKDAQTKRAARP